MKILGIVILVLSANTLQAQTGVPIPAEFFGLHVIHGTQDYPIIPFGTFRFWDNHTRWQVTNTAPGVYNWTDVDDWLNVLGLHNVKDVEYDLGGTPQWASSVPTDATCFYTSDGNGACDPPLLLNVDGTGSNKNWRLWVAAVSQHAKNSKSVTRVKSWSIWNEFTRQPGHLIGTQTAAWTGTNAQMLRLAEDARCIIAGRGSITATKESCAQVQTTVGLTGPVDTTALIMAPSIGIFTASSTALLNSYIAAGGSTASEAYAIHPYATGTNPVQPESVIQKIIDWRAQLPPSEKSKSVWATEGAWASTSSETDADLQSAFVARYYLLLWAANVSRVYWYGYDYAPSALWVTNTGLTKAGITYQTMYNWMVGSSMNFLCNGPKYPATGVYTCGFVQENGTQALAVWDSSKTCTSGSCATSSFSYDPKFVSSEDASGNVSNISGLVMIGAKPIVLFNVPGVVLLQGKIGLH